MTKIGSITMNSIEMYAAGGNAKEYFGEAKLWYMILSLLINVMNLITLPIQAVGMIFITIFLRVKYVAKEDRVLYYKWVFGIYWPIGFVATVLVNLDVLTFGRIEKLSSKAQEVCSELYELKCNL